MPFGKSAEEKAEEQRARDEQAARDAEAEARRAYLASPVGQADAAMQAGQGFFEAQLIVGASQRDTTAWSTNKFALTRRDTPSHAGTLAAIEALGWSLEHVGYVFVMTGQSSRDTFLIPGQETDVSGHTVGVYLFRNAKTDSTA